MKVESLSDYPQVGLCWFTRRQGNGRSLIGQAIF